MDAKALRDGISALALPIEPERQEHLLRYLGLLEKWNRVYNLTAIRERTPMVTQHLLDCLAIVPFVRTGRCLDVGSGPGLPGIPLAIARPDLSIVLLDSSRKKCAFLQQAIIDLQINHASVACARIEDYRAESGFDAVVTRAFADTAHIAKVCAPQLAPHGEILAMKANLRDERMAEIGTHAVVKSVIRLNVPGMSAERNLVIMTKP
jgi:16S rRNA (guanine527-N7)-methyltransferase